MPIYEYVCEDCGTKYEKVVLNKAQEIACPKCESPKRTLQLFGVQREQWRRERRVGQRSGQLIPVVLRRRVLRRLRLKASHAFSSNVSQ